MIVRFVVGLFLKLTFRCVSPNAKLLSRTSARCGTALRATRLMSLQPSPAKLSHAQLLQPVVDSCESLPELKNKSDALIAEVAPLPPSCVDVFLSPDLLPRIFSSLVLSDHAVAGVCTTWFRAFSRHVRRCQPPRVRQLRADANVLLPMYRMLPDGALMITSITMCESYRCGLKFIAERIDSNLAACNLAMVPTSSLAARRFEEPRPKDVVAAPQDVAAPTAKTTCTGRRGCTGPSCIHEDDDVHDPWLHGPLVRSHDDLHDPCAALHKFAKDAASKLKGILCRTRRADPEPSRAQLRLQQEILLERQRHEAWKCHMMQRVMHTVMQTVMPTEQRLELAKQLYDESARRKQSVEILVTLLELATQHHELRDESASEMMLGQHHLYLWAWDQDLLARERELWARKEEQWSLELQTLRLEVLDEENFITITNTLEE